MKLAQASVWGCALALLASTGCGGDDSGGVFDPDNFAGMYMPEVMYDCEQTVQCKAQQGGSLLDNPIVNCSLETGELLNGSGDRQDKFLANYGRCSAFVVCDYVNCANAEGASYGDTKRPEIGSFCAAQVECNLVRGTGGDTQNLCVERKVNELNSFILAVRDMWDSSFAACSGMAGCTFTECFDAAFLRSVGP